MNTTTTPTVRVATPAPLHTRDSSASFKRAETDLYVFGYTFTSSTVTSESRHDRKLSRGPSSEFPPSYSESHRDIVPSYMATYEPATLAMYLFRFGFLFPPFWLMGAFILFTPLHAPPSPSRADEESTIGSWLPEKSEAEKEAFISHMRKAELKYAKCCLIAFVVFAVLAGVAAGLTVWATSK